MTISSLTPVAAQRAIAAGATLVDIREPDEHARERIPGAVNAPLSQLRALPQSAGGFVFHCRSGMRTQANAARLTAAAGGAECYVFAGGIEAWRGAGLPTATDRPRPIEVMRQVQLIAGVLVLVGVILGLSAFAGAGLTIAGATGWCGLANLLRLMPWNRQDADGRVPG